MPSNGQGAQQVINCIISRLADGNLRPSDNDGLLQVFNHKRQSAGSVGHCICPMQDNEGIILVIDFLDFAQYHVESVNAHVGGVDEILQFKVAIGDRVARN